MGEEKKEEEKKEKKDKYMKFWKEFGKDIKLGVIEDSANRSKLAKLLRFKTTKSEGKEISLDKYIARMKEWQTDLYYIAGESLEEVENSPFLGELKRKDLEVLLLTDPIDEYVTQNLIEYDDKKLQSVTKAGLKFGDSANMERIMRNQAFADNRRSGFMV